MAPKPIRKYENNWWLCSGTTSCDTINKVRCVLFIISSVIVLLGGLALLTAALCSWLGVLCGIAIAWPCGLAAVGTAGTWGLVSAWLVLLCHI
jgi:hypothetical protein